MKLYHTSDQIISHPNIEFSRDFLDFGKGFYLTHYIEQAERYGQRFKLRNKEAWMNIYELTITKDFKIKKFDSYDKEWLKFISECRSGSDFSTFELIIGGIANDKVIRTLDRYFNGEISPEQALGLLKFEKPNIQYCIRSQEIIDKYLTFLDCKKL